MMLKRRTPEEQLAYALTPFVEAYLRQSDPGTSDLDNEQPFSVRVTLGDCRRAFSVLNEADKRTELRRAK